MCYNDFLFTVSVEYDKNSFENIYFGLIPTTNQQKCTISFFHEMPNYPNIYIANSQGKDIGFFKLLQIHLHSMLLIKKFWLWGYNFVHRTKNMVVFRIIILSRLNHFRPLQQNIIGMHRQNYYTTYEWNVTAGFSFNLTFFVPWHSPPLDQIVRKKAG